jgi:cytoskeletal protein RodZ
MEEINRFKEIDAHTETFFIKIFIKIFAEFMALNHANIMKQLFYFYH